MKILAIANNLPSARHSALGAVSMVLHHVLHGFRQAGHEVVLQCIYQADDRRSLTPGESQDLAEATAAGIRVLPDFFRSDYAPPGGQVGAQLTRVAAKLLHAPWRFYPALRLRSRMAERVASEKPDLIFIFWCSEGMAATDGLTSVPRFAYYGVPDHLAELARVENPTLFGRPTEPREIARRKAILAEYERHHVKLMLGCDVISNLCAAHAEYYAKHGHQHSLYIQNLWPTEPSTANTPPPTNPRPRLLGSLGTLQSTGNSLGLHYLGTEILPRLDAVYGRDGYEVHIYGKGQLAPPLVPLLQHPAIKLRGFVDDIDGEIRAADLFLVLGNACSYRGSHTRFLHAWSLRACVIGHEFSHLANPEMVHGENMLLGDTPDDIVRLIQQAIADPDLRTRLGEAGYQTYRQHFTPEAVVQRLLCEMTALRHAKRRG
jgi:glycosyltransferase involved in cell wall biosynthesis